MVAMADENSQRTEWGMNACMVAEEIGFGATIPRKCRVSCSDLPESLKAGSGTLILIRVFELF